MPSRSKLEMTTRLEMSIQKIEKRTAITRQL